MVVKVGKGVTNDESERCFLYQQHPEVWGGKRRETEKEETRKTGARPGNINDIAIWGGGHLAP